MKMRLYVRPRDSCARRVWRDDVLSGDLDALAVGSELHAVIHAADIVALDAAHRQGAPHDGSSDRQARRPFRLRRDRARSASPEWCAPASCRRSVRDSRPRRTRNYRERYRRRSCHPPACDCQFPSLLRDWRGQVRSVRRSLAAEAGFDWTHCPAGWTIERWIGAIGSYFARWSSTAASARPRACWGIPSRASVLRCSGWKPIWACG